MLRSAGPRFSGILNGIDLEAWCPSGDLALSPACRFSAAEPARKEDAKRALLAELGLPYTPPDEQAESGALAWAVV